MSTQSLRWRLNEFIGHIEECERDELLIIPNSRDAADIRALLRLHKEAKRELAVCKKALRRIDDIQTDTPAYEMLSVIVESLIELNLKGVTL